MVTLSMSKIHDNSNRILSNNLPSEDITERNLVKEALQESERRYRTLVETLQEGLVIVDPDENIIFANAAYCKIFGYSCKEIIGMNLRDFVPSEQFQNILQETAKREKSVASQYDLIVKRKDGELINIRVSASPWMNEKGELQGTIGVVLDITEQLQAEKALRAKEKKYRELANLLQQTVFEMDAEGNFRFINVHGLELFGYTIQDIIQGLNVVQFFIPEDHDRIKKDIRRVLNGENLSGEEYTAQRRNGSTFPIITYSSPIINEGRATGLRGFAIDITERKRAEEALVESKKRYRILYDENLSMYFTLNTKGVILSVNKFGAEQLGYTAEELVGQSIIDIFYKKDQKNVISEFTNWLQNPTEVAHWEFRKVRKDGSVIWVKETARLVVGTDGDRVILVVCEDISEHVKARMEKKRLTKQLAEADKLVTLGQFTAALTHEINNPLDIIQNKLFLLQKSLLKNNQNSELLGYVNKIRQQVTRISNLSEDILNYGKPRLITLKPVDINRIILNAIELLSDYFTEAIFLETNLKPNLPIIHGDAIGLEIVFKNLLLNAVESIQRKGKITIDTEIIKNELIEIKIKDSGIGIPEKDLTKIFDPFFSRKRKSRGAGLGLTICQKIIEENRGTIKIASKPNVGTAVIVQFEVN